MSNRSRADIEELAADARAILGSKVLQLAFEDMERDCIQKLRGIPVGDLTAAHAHATLHVMNDLQNYLQSYINEAAMQGRK